MSLTLVTHIGNVGVFKREPNFHFIVFSSVLSHIRNPISFRLITPCLSLPCKRDHFDRFKNLFLTLMEVHNPTFSMPNMRQSCNNETTPLKRKNRTFAIHSAEPLNRKQCLQSRQLQLHDSWPSFCH